MVKTRHNNIIEILFVAALATKPIYIGASGTLQISDYIYLVLLFVCLIKSRFLHFDFREYRWIKTFAIVILYQLVVNIIAYIVTTNKGNIDERFLRFNLFYIFNFLVCLTIFQISMEIGYERLVKLYLLGSVLSIVICYLGIALNYRGTGRERGFFNNPNQLGYFAIIIMTIFVIYYKETNRRFRFLVIMLSLILNILSLSKASIIGSAVLLVMYVIISNSGKEIKKIILKVLLIIIVMIGIYLLMFADIEFLTNNYYIRTMRRRITLMQYENDTDLGEGRGYDRIKEIGIWIFTGVGEGAFNRFAAASGKELHSMYASIIVSYGLIGFAGYLYLFSKALFAYGNILYSIMEFSGILLYCVTHNGVRNTLLWSLIAILLLRPKGAKYESDIERTNFISEERDQEELYDI